MALRLVEHRLARGPLHGWAEDERDDAGEELLVQRLVVQDATPGTPSPDALRLLGSLSAAPTPGR